MLGLRATRSVSSLKLHSVSITEEGAQELSMGLADNGIFLALPLALHRWHRIRELTRWMDGHRSIVSLTEVEITNAGLTPAGWAHICTALQRNPNITYGCS